MASVRLVRAAVIVGGLLPAALGCPSSSSSTPSSPEATPTTSTPAFGADGPVVPLEGEALRDPVGVVVGRLQLGPRMCARVRSLRQRDEAEAAAATIRAATALPVEVIEKDLGDKGIWYRVCVGDEADEARLTTKATRWVAADGILAPYLDPPRSPDEARFTVLPLPSAAARRPSDAQAKALLARSHSGAAAFLVGPVETPVLVSTTAAGDRLVAIDHQGAPLLLDSAPSPGCASCALVMTESPIVARRVLGAGDVFGGPDDELLIEEETQRGARCLSVLEVERTRLRRMGGVVLAHSGADVVTRAAAAVVEADGDDRREIVVTRLELRSRQGDLCSLSTSVEIWGARAEEAGLDRLPSTFARPPGDDGAGVLDLVTALDQGGDPAMASLVCADALRDRPQGHVGQLCFSRIRTLTAAGRAIDAVNAAGAIAERAPTLRAAVAGPLFSAMQALDGDPRLSTATWDCEATPLVKGAATMPVDEVLALARARLAERLSLSDVHDAVFVTASRDFGTETPVFAIAARWLERLRVTQPARHAAIEAALLPMNASSTTSTTAAATDATPGFGGAP
jgi:hypothetical protein